MPHRPLTDLSPFLLFESVKRTVATNYESNEAIWIKDFLWTAGIECVRNFGNPSYKSRFCYVPLDPWRFFVLSLLTLFLGTYIVSIGYQWLQQYLAKKWLEFGAQCSPVLSLYNIFIGNVMLTFGHNYCLLHLHTWSIGTNSHKRLCAASSLVAIVW